LPESSLKKKPKDAQQLWMQLRTKRYEPVLEWMSFKRETPEPIEQRDAGNVRRPHLRGVILRKRILAAFALVLLALMNTMYLYHRSAYLRNNRDWRWFWVGEVFTGVWLVFAVVQVLRKGP
jgi:hypothetical protein